MRKNKIILSHCSNFYKIKNFEYDENDYITNKLFSIYEDYIFNIDIKDVNNIKKIEQIDYILGKYIDDYNFRKEIKSGLMNLRVRRDNNIVDSIIDSIIRMFDNYEEGYTRNIYFARWI